MELKGQIPERRPDPEELERARADRGEAPRGGAQEGKSAVWRCRVCGYLAARESAPRVCPICKAGQDRFEPFPWP